nr:putative Gag-polypeptide of LTR copia-type [Tanacetum cinerariifolium]
MSGDGNSSSDLSLQLADLLKNGLNLQPQTPKLSVNLQINLKLNSQNYALWTRMIRVAIGEKSKTLLSYMTSNPPDQDSKEYEQWEQEDLIVFSWLIQNIKPVLAGNLTECPTAKTLWDDLVVTYSSGDMGRNRQNRSKSHEMSRRHQAILKPQRNEKPGYGIGD